MNVTNPELNSKITAIADERGERPADVANYLMGLGVAKYETQVKSAEAARIARQKEIAEAVAALEIGKQYVTARQQKLVTLVAIHGGRAVVSDPDGSKVRMVLASSLSTPEDQAAE